MNDETPGDGRARARRWLVVGGAFYALFALAGAGWILHRGGGALLRERLVGQAPLRDVALGLAVGLALAGAVAVLGPHVPALVRLEDAFARLLGGIGWGTAALLALFSGLGEELLFRGALQPEIGLLGASLAFGAVHFPAERGLVVWPLFAFAAGLLLGWLFRETGSLPAPIAAHFAVNLVGLGRLGRPRRSKPTDREDRPRAAAG